MYLGESIAQQGGWVAIKVVDKVDLLKTKEIGNPGCDPDQDSSETEPNDNGNTTKDSSIEEDSDPDSESDLVSMSMRTPRSMVAETDHEKHSGSKHLLNIENGKLVYIHTQLIDLIL